MTREEIRAGLQAKGILDTSGSRDPLWVQAFELHNQGKSQKLKMGCGSCYNIVRQWLKS